MFKLVVHTLSFFSTVTAIMFEPMVTDLENSAANLDRDDDTAQPTTPLDQLDNPSNPQETESVQKREQLRGNVELLEQQPALLEWRTLGNILRAHPQDPEKWDKLVELAESSGNIDVIKETYEGLLKTYPNTVC
jgi:cleavage stimulation factor subunit 3